jgi:hypothetical protein
MTVPFPEPTTPVTSRAAVFLGYLDYFRGRLVTKLAGLTEALHAQAARTRAIALAHDLAEAGQPGERWDGKPPATLERILFHLLQEYARHLGHLDVATELAGGPTGE